MGILSEYCKFHYTEIFSEVNFENQGRTTDLKIALFTYSSLTPIFQKLKKNPAAA